MAKLLVIPSRSFMNAASSIEMANAGARGGAASMATASALTVPALLDRRRYALDSFITNITDGTSKGMAGARSAGSISTGGGASMSASGEGASSSVKALPALGAIIIDEELIDRRAMERGLAATIFENVMIPLVTPTSWFGQSTAVTDPDKVDTWHLDDINIATVRAGGLTGEGVLIGVLDTGVDAGHPELDGRVLAFQEFDEDGYEIQSPAHDPSDHGTHVCGLIAGAKCGVAPDAQLAVASVLTEETSEGYAGYLVQIAAGLDWLLTTSFRDGEEPGVDVLSASLGGAGYDDYLYQPLADARLTTGTLMIAAIGNAGRRGIDHHGSPGNYDLCIGVGATDARHRVARFSDWGTVLQHDAIAKPDLCAPGVDVWSCVPDGKYDKMSGTSMATPIVAGVAALLLQREPELRSSADILRKTLLSLTSTPPSGSRAGRGRLDLSSM